MNFIPMKRDSWLSATYNIALVHPFDIRGTKIGGLETYIRDFVTFCPENTRVLFVGVDAVGDMKLGRITETTFRGRHFDFMPILHYPDERAREAARRVRDLDHGTVLWRTAAVFAHAGAHLARAPVLG